MDGNSIAGGSQAIQELPAIVRSRVRDALGRLSEDPWSMPFKKLRGRPFYRIRVGDWGVVYSVDEARREVYVVAIDKRSRVYREV